VLRTDRLELTTWSSHDLPELAALHGDPVAMQHLASGMQNAEETRARLQSWQREHAAQGWSKWRVQTLDGRFVGRAGFSRAHKTRCREVGYLLAPQFWGCGLATELVNALTCRHHQNYDAALDPDLLAYVLSTNAASRHVLEKTGFRFLGADSNDPRQLIYRNRR
jgi:RimJ/RimL family protein N-acetyltransferase